MTSPSPSDQRPLYAGSPNHLASIDKARSSPISQVRIDLQSLKLADHVSQQSCVHIKLNDNTQTQRRPLPNSTHLYELAKVETQNPNDFLRVPSMFLKCRRPLPSHNGHLRHRSRSQVQLGDARESSNHFQLTGLRNKTGAVLRASVSSTGESSSAESTFEDGLFSGIPNILDIAISHFWLNGALHAFASQTRSDHIVCFQITRVAIILLPCRFSSLDYEPCKKLLRCNKTQAFLFFLLFLTTSRLQRVPMKCLPSGSSGFFS